MERSGGGGGANTAPCTLWFLPSTPHRLRKLVLFSWPVPVFSCCWPHPPARDNHRSMVSTTNGLLKRQTSDGDRNGPFGHRINWHHTSVPPLAQKKKKKLQCIIHQGISVSVHMGSGKRCPPHRCLAYGISIASQSYIKATLVLVVILSCACPLLMSLTYCQLTQSHCSSSEKCYPCCSMDTMVLAGYLSRHFTLKWGIFPCPSNSPASGLSTMGQSHDRGTSSAQPNPRQWKV